MFAFQPGVSRTPSRPTLPSPIRPRPTWVIPPPARKQFVHRFTPSKPTLRTRIPAFPWTGAVGGARTHTPSREGDFKSPVSAISPRRRFRLAPRGCRERTPRCKPWYGATGSTPIPAILSKRGERQDARMDRIYPLPMASQPLPSPSCPSRSSCPKTGKDRMRGMNRIHALPPPSRQHTSGQNPDLHNHDSNDNDAQRPSSPSQPSLPSLLKTVSPSHPVHPVHPVQNHPSHPFGIPPRAGISR